MDDVVVRPRYPRSKIHRRRRRYNRNNNEFSQKIALQVLICLGILAFAAIIKYVNLPFLNYLEGKITTIIKADIEVKGVYEGIDNILNALAGSSEKNKAEEDTSFDEEAVPAAVQNEAYLGEEYSNESSSSQQDTSRISTSDTRTSRSGSIQQEVITLPEGVKLISPVAGPVGSPFGERVHPIKKEESFHKGVDIEANKGAPIKAVLDGEIIEAGSEKTLGNYVRISHQGGLTTTYAHCSTLVAKKGQKVKQGTVIAKVGNTGASVGAHLHFELWKNGIPVDPQLYIDIPTKN